MHDAETSNWLGSGVGPSSAGDGGRTILSQFRIVQPGVTLADATVLVPLVRKSSRDAFEANALDLANDPDSVALYKFHVPTRPFLAFGAVIRLAALRGKALLSSLSRCVDANGKVLAVIEHRRPHGGRTPICVCCLAPTYCIGVSARQAPLPGGYDPVAGTPISIPHTQPGRNVPFLSMAVTSLLLRLVLPPSFLPSSSTTPTLSTRARPPTCVQKRLLDPRSGLRSRAPYRARHKDGQSYVMS